MHKKTLFVLALMGLTAIASAADGTPDSAGPFYASLSAGQLHGYGKSLKAVKATLGYDLLTMALWPGSQVTGSIEASRMQTESDGPDRLNFSSEGVYLKASVRESESLSVNARVGYANTGIHDNFMGMAGHGYSQKMAWGAGLSYKLDKNWSLNADFDRYKTGSQGWTQNLNMVSAGVGYRF